MKKIEIGEYKKKDNCNNDNSIIKGKFRECFYVCTYINFIFNSNIY